jgi:hypothetical protein
VTQGAAEPVVIGVTEYVDIPEWRILRLRAKIDTGARSSALHVENIRELPGGLVRFDVRLNRKQSDRRVSVEAKVVRRGQVRPSNGELQARIFVSVRVRIGPVEREIELSLVDRGRMIFRMLIGRRALSNAFWIDPSRRFVLRKPSYVTGADAGGAPPPVPQSRPRKTSESNLVPERPRRNRRG